MRPLGLVPAVLVLLAGCTDVDDPGPEPAPTVGADTAAPATGPTPTSPTPSSPSPSAPAPTGGAATGTAASTGWDCAAVEQARQDLADATNAALERVGVDRSDPRAFSVQVIATAQRGDEYWSTVRDAIPAEETRLRADAGTVASYWTSVDEDLEAIDLTGGDLAALQRATDRYLEVMAEHPEVEVLAVQERLTADVDAACAQAPSP